MIKFIHKQQFATLLSVMIKRRNTLDHTEKIKKNKQVETLNILDLCLQIPVDDRLILHRKVKNGDEELSSRIYQCKKDKDFHQLQIYLRKYLQNMKASNKYSYSAYKSRQSPNSHKINKTPSSTRLLNNHTQTQFSHRNQSIKESYHSSPQHQHPAIHQFQKKIPDFRMIQKKIDFQTEFEQETSVRRHINSQNRSKKEEIRRDGNSEIQDRRRERRRQSQSDENNPFAPRRQSSHREMKINKIPQHYQELKLANQFQNSHSNFNISMNIKQVIKQKLRTQQQRLQTSQMIPDRLKQNRLMIGNNNPYSFRNTRILTQQNSQQYGQFYKRIKMAIEDDI